MLRQEVDYCSQSCCGGIRTRNNKHVSLSNQPVLRDIRCLFGEQIGEEVGAGDSSLSSYPLADLIFGELEEKVEFLFEAARDGEEDEGPEQW